MNNNPIRILHYIGSLNCGGSQSLVMNLYKNIDKNKIQFDFIIDRKTETHYVNEIKKMGGKIYYMDYYKLTNHFSFKKQWNDFFKKHKEYKVIHIHVRSVASIVINIAHKYNIKTITHSHNTSNGKNIKSILKALYQRKIRRISDYFMACSKESAIWLFGKKIINNSKCYILNNAIDVDKFKFINSIRLKKRKELNLNDNNILLGFIGRLEKQKNPMFCLEIINEIIRYSKKYKLLIIGNGSLKKEVLDYINNNKLNDYVIFLKDRDDINELMQAIDILLMPSLYEGLPLTLIEAQTSSLNTIISDKIKDGIINKKIVKSVKLDVNNWIKQLFKLKIKRYDQSQIIVDNNYDIKSISRFMEDYYIEVCKKNILFVSGSKNRAGAQRVITNLANEMIKDNKVSIVNTICYNDGYHLDRRINEYSLDNYKRRGFILKNIIRIKKLRKIYKDVNPDVIISFLPEVSYRVILANIFINKKIIVSVRNNPENEYNNIFKKLLVKVLYSKADGFVFQSDNAKKYFSKSIQSKSIVIYNPIGNDFINNKFNGKRVNEIVSVGRLEKQKNHLLLLDVFKKIKGNYKLKIYGNGKLKNKLQKYIDDNNLSERVFLMGEYENISKQIYKSSLFILTSNYEGLPNSLIEAMALGIPCVSTRCFENDLIKDNYNIIMTEINNKEDIINKVNNILSNKKLYNKISNNAYKIGDKLQTSVITRKWINFIERSINNGCNSKKK